MANGIRLRYRANNTWYYIDFANDNLRVEFAFWENRKTTRFERFAGFQDTDGIEIWEGDIVKVKEWTSRGDGTNDDALGEVKFYEGCFHVKFDDGTDELLYALDGEAEVISNIHEHPELLNQKEKA